MYPKCSIGAYIDRCKFYYSKVVGDHRDSNLNLSYSIDNGAEYIYALKLKQSLAN